MFIAGDVVLMLSRVILYAVLLHKSYNLAMYFGPNILLLHMLKENSVRSQFIFLAFNARAVIVIP